MDAPHSKVRSLALGPIKPLDPLGSLVYSDWGHRGPLHSLPGLAAFGLIAALPLALRWGGEYGAALVLGYGSHLALDAMTRHGVPLLAYTRAGRAVGPEAPPAPIGGIQCLMRETVARPMPEPLKSRSP